MVTTTITISFRSCHVLAFRPVGTEHAQLNAFCNTATALKLPVHVCEANQVDTATLEELVRKIGPPRRGDTEIALLICGSYFEEQISLAAQYLLIVGFKVVLLRDIIWSRTPEHSQFHDLRLNQSGALLTTLHQLHYEWMATEEDKAVRDVLTSIPFA